MIKRFMVGLGLMTVALAVQAQCTIGAVGTAPAASIIFTAPTKNTDGTTISGALTYNVYQGTVSGAEVKVASGLAGSPIAVSSGLAGGATYYWYVTAVAGGGESAKSNEVCKSFPASVPGAVVITIT